MQYWNLLSCGFFEGFFVVVVRPNQRETTTSSTRCWRAFLRTRSARFICRMLRPTTISTRCEHAHTRHNSAQHSESISGFTNDTVISAPRWHSFSRRGFMAANVKLSLCLKSMHWYDECWSATKGSLSTSLTARAHSHVRTYLSHSHAAARCQSGTFFRGFLVCF